MDKMELLSLQSSLKAELEAKEVIKQELRSTKAHAVAVEKYVHWSDLYKTEFNPGI